MRLALTIGIDTKGKAELIHGPDVLPNVQRAAWKAMVAEGIPKKFSLVALCYDPKVLRAQPAEK